MDMQRLRQILIEFNPIFWNSKVDDQLEKSNYPNQSPIKSAKYRYLVLLRNRGKFKHFKNLFKEIEECLSPYDRIFEVLLDVFPGQFAKTVLLTHQKLIENFHGISTDNYESWTGFLVCMTYKDFWFDPNKTDAKQTSGEARDERKTTPETERNATAVKWWRWIWPWVKKIPRWIYVAVLFLAALLTVFYYLGWI